ncbi:hypothetical protein [Streptomyces globisporus]|uniref:hypothetical protein n=1 Tax=Streptomyces globisporus TaxID=1908 RepID=UPI0004C61E94|nr:hypothetical protein [Streptomyces globisporus]
MHAAPRRTAVTALLCAAFALGATACGPSSEDAKPAGPFGELSGSQIVDKAFAATKGAKALSVDIDEREAAEPIEAYLSLDAQGRCTGTLTTGTTSTVELIRPDHRNVYLRFDEASLREQVEGEDPETQEAMLKELRGRWVKGSASDPDNKDLLELCDLKQLLGGFEQGASGIVKGAETAVGGKKALALTEPGDGGESSTVYVATEGTPYVLRIVTKGGEDPGTITFSKYGKPVGAKAPAAKDVVETD